MMCKIEECSNCIYNPFSEMHECMISDYAEVDEDFECPEGEEDDKIQKFKTQ